MAVCARALDVTTSDLLGQPFTQILRRDRLDEMVHAVHTTRGEEQ